MTPHLNFNAAMVRSGGSVSSPAFAFCVFCGCFLLVLVAPLRLCLLALNPVYSVRAHGSRSRRARKARGVTQEIP